MKLWDAHGVEHSAKVRAGSLYEAALGGLERLEKVGWESNESQIGSVTVEVYEEPTRHTANVKRLLEWLKQPGRVPADERRKEKLRALAK